MIHRTRSRRPLARPRLEILEERLAPAIRVWTGAGGDNLWSNPANWDTGVPQNSDDLQFPATSALISNNDLTDISMNSITFTTGSGYTLVGNSLPIDVSIATNSGTGTNRIDFGISTFSTLTIDVAAGTTLILSGVVDGGASIAKINPGELLLTGDNTFAGSLILSVGILTLGSNTALGTATLTASGGTTFRPDASPRTLANDYSLDGPTPITIGGAAPLTLTGIGLLVSSSVTLNVANTSLTTLSGDIRLGTTSSQLTKEGPGTLALGGTNTYGPTVVNAGVLFVNGTQSGGSATVNSGATLGGTGVVGPLTTAGGIVSPGLSPGILSAASAVFDPAATFRVELNGAVPGSGHDQLAVSASVDLAGSTLAASLGFPSALGDTFVIIQAGVGVTGTFAGLANNAIFAIGGRPFRINYNSNDVTLTRVQGSTSLALTANPPSSVYGQAVTFTATVSFVPPGGSVPTGTVTFRDGNTVIGSGTLNAAGQATFTTTNLAVGAHTIDAVYGGDANYTGSTSPPLPFTVSRAPTSTTLTVSANAVDFNQPVTFTATVGFNPGGANTPTGTVTFRDGGNVLGTAAVNAAGQATFTTSSLAPGTHSIDAVYSGDLNYLGSTSPAAALVVNRLATTTTLTVSANPAGFNQPVTFTATVAFPAGGPVPTGAVTFREGATILGTGVLNAAGQATFTTSTLAAATHTIVAEYGGDTIYLGSTSAPLTLTVVGGDTRTVVTTSANPAGINQPVTFTVTVSAVVPGGAAPTGTVTLSIFPEGRRHPVRDLIFRATVTLTNGVAQITVPSLPPGCLVVVATYSGDPNFNPSAAPDLLQSVLATPNQAYVIALYRDVLERTADVSGLNFWVGQLDAGVSRDAVATSFWLSEEHRGLQVDLFYRILLKRAADPAGRAFWLNTLLGGTSEVEVVAGIASSPEYTASHPTAEDYVNGLYLDLLDRAADPGGLAARARRQLGLEQRRCRRLSSPRGPSSRRPAPGLPPGKAPGRRVQRRSGPGLSIALRGIRLAAGGDDGLRRRRAGLHRGRPGGNGRPPRPPRRAARSGRLARRLAADSG